MLDIIKQRIEFLLLIVALCSAVIGGIQYFAKDAELKEVQYKLEQAQKFIDKNQYDNSKMQVQFVYAEQIHFLEMLKTTEELKHYFNKDEEFRLNYLVKEVAPRLGMQAPFDNYLDPNKLIFKKYFNEEINTTKFKLPYKDENTRE